MNIFNVDWSLQTRISLFLTYPLTSPPHSRHPSPNLHILCVIIKLYALSFSRIFSGTANFHFTTTPWFGEKRESHLAWVAIFCHTTFMKGKRIVIEWECDFSCACTFSTYEQMGFLYVFSYNFNLESLLPMLRKLFAKKNLFIILPAVKAM